MLDVIQMNLSVVMGVPMIALDPVHHQAARIVREVVQDHVPEVVLAVLEEDVLDAVQHVPVGVKEVVQALVQKDVVRPVI